MIDKALFTDRMGDLDQHFYGDRPESVLRDYYEMLNPRMDDESFERACRQLIWDRPPGDGFPSAREIVEAAELDQGLEARAANQTEVLRELMRDWRRANVDRLDDVGRRALAAVGGIKELALLPREKANWRLKEFRKTYKALAEGAEREAGALPDMTDEGRGLIEDALAGELEGADAD